MSSRAKQQLLWVTGSILLFAFSANHLLGQRKATEFYGDESGWMDVSFRAAQLLFDGKFGPRELTLNRGTYGNLNPQLGKLMLGVPLSLYSDHYLDGLRFQRAQPYVWNNERWGVKRAKGEVPPRRLLHAGRAVTAIYGAICVVVAFAAGAIWFDARVGLLAALLLLGTSAFVESTTRVMTDVYYSLFMLAGCLAASISSRGSSSRRDLVLAAVCGVLGGLASAVKVTGFLLVGAVYVVVTVLRAVREGWAIRPVAQRLAIYTATALTCIYALNPFYWPEFDRIQPRELLREIGQVVSGDDSVELSPEALEKLGGIYYFRGEIVATIPQIYAAARPLEFPIQFVRWKELWKRQEKLLPWEGPRVPIATRKLAVELTAFRFEWVFLLLGILYCVRSTILDWRASKVSPRVAVLTWLVFILLGILMAAPRPEDRFFAPAVIATRILVAAGIWLAIDQALKWLRARRWFPIRAL